ncbi:MAG: DUF4835 family protein [Pseudoflavonifractor sp.]|nr:DUF4835 family protein [Pseudoflavonifractor sp.]
MKKILFTIMISVIAWGVALGEELNCSVEINSQQVEGSNKEVFNTLQGAIADYMNTTKWSNAQFSPNEKIECKLFFTIKKYENDVMSGDLQIQSTRPVYNSSYTTTLINFKDTKIEFTYRENEPLIHSENTMESNLTAILDFYAYLILAIDFDSFSPHGGDQFYEKADAVVQMAQSTGESGWKAFEDTKNRSAVLSAYTQPSTSGIRDLLYTYHRNGLDEMSTSPDKGRAKITESLEQLKKIYDASPMSVALSMFRDAKLDELVNIYSKSPQAEREGVYELLYPLYPTDNDRLTKIKNGTNK